MSTSQGTTALLSEPPLGDLRRLVEQSGPFASVLVEVDPASEDRARRLRLRWEPLAESLEEAGTPSDDIEALTSVVLGSADGGRALAAVGTGGSVVVAERHLEEPATEYARWAPVPSLAPIVEWRQLTPAHVVVLVDRTGADIEVAGPRGTDFETEVAGEHDEIDKPQSGGWSHRRYHERAEDSWARNADEVATRVAGLADDVDAALVILAGDPQARGLVEESLGARSERRIETLDHGSRHAGRESVGDDLLHLVATVSAEDTVTLLEVWKQELGRGERAVEGGGATTEALAAARVETLLVHDQPGDDRLALVGPEPQQVATEASNLTDAGVDDPERARLTDACIRAALGTGASVRVVPGHGGPEDGVGAILRWA